LYKLSYIVAQLLTHALQIAIWRNGNQELVLNAFINLEFGMGFEVFPDCGFRVISDSPMAIA